MTQGPEDKDGKKKRKVPKTMIFGVDDVKAEQPAQTQEPTQPQIDSPAPASTEKKRKVPKTLLFETKGALEEAVLQAAVETDKEVAAEAKAVAEAAEAKTEAARAHAQSEAEQTESKQHNQQAPEEAAPTPDAGGKKRKVPKTLLFDTAALKEKAAEIDAAAQQPTPQSTPESAAKSPTESPAEPAANPEAPPDVQGGQKRKVPKTLLFEVPVAEKAAEKTERKISKTILEETDTLKSAAARLRREAAEQAEAEQAEAEQAGAAETSVRDDDAPPELNIDGPQVKLFFEKEDELDVTVVSAEESPTAQVAQEAGPEVVPAAWPEASAEEPGADSAVTDFSPPEPAAEEKPKRKVPRTLLFNPVIGSDGEEVAPEQAEDKNAPRKISTRKIAKTLLDHKPISAEQIIAASMDPPLDETEAEKVVERYIARTMLDHSILFDQLSKSQHHAQEKAEEELKERLNEPFKPFIPIECKKTALDCPFTWDATYAKEKYRYCDKCQRPVYNFAGLEIADAEAIILKAENRSKFTLYKRTDGLFMTGDCPVAMKKRSDMILMSVGGFLLALCLVGYMMMLPKPKPQPAAAPQAVPTTAHPDTDNLPGVHRIPTSGTAGGNYESWVRDESGHLVRRKPPAQQVQQAPQPAPQQLPPPVQAPQQEDWVFPNGEK